MINAYESHDFALSSLSKCPKSALLADNPALKNLLKNASPSATSALERSQKYSHEAETPYEIFSKTRRGSRLPLSIDDKHHAYYRQVAFISCEYEDVWMKKMEIVA